MAESRDVNTSQNYKCSANNIINFGLLLAPLERLGTIFNLGFIRLVVYVCPYVSLGSSRVYILKIKKFL
jgi:hypothetical protein